MEFNGPAVGKKKESFFSNPSSGGAGRALTVRPGDSR